MARLKRKKWGGEWWYSKKHLRDKFMKGFLSGMAYMLLVFGMIWYGAIP